RMPMNATVEQILEYVNTLEIIDTHEHLPCSETVWLQEYQDNGGDVFKEYLKHYFPSDLVSAGLPERELNTIMTSDLPVPDKWARLKSYWEVARYTGYGRALDIAVRGIYGIEGINRDTIEEVNAAFWGSLKPGHFRYVLKELCQIKTSLLDSLEGSLDSDPEFFNNVFRMDPFIMPKSLEEIHALERLTGIRITSFDAWCECCRATLEAVLKKGVVALKCALAYRRSLQFDRPTRAVAEAEFTEFLAGIYRSRKHPQIPLMGHNCQNYMMHYILGLANQRQLAYQFHTGLQEGNGNHIAHSDPTLLSNLFLDYPDVRFDLFHISYPFQQQLSALAKVFPNVFIDMCWAHIISPQASIAALTEWLDAVPFNKINAFGGDYLFVDGVYGHQYLARENVSKALALKVEDGVFDLDQAKEIARCLFYDNPARLFTLD
ncbi:amidohydrolase family protein, partial [candidate division KSB3 bacterium]|nr:amidohydrolase family protein [candidate division KSB3 bacterium]MBD3326299.1 amidohydrolase family protein [candidate division KSB3 bacterium]